MPNPAAPPPRVAAPTENLDLLIREAMRGGSIEKLRSALSTPAPQAPAAPAPYAPAAPAPRPLPTSPASRPTPPLPPAAEPRTTEAWLDTLTQHLDAARAAWDRHDTAAILRSLEALEQQASLARDSLARDSLARESLAAASLPNPEIEAEVVPAVRLPPLLAPIRVAYALVVDGLGDPSRAPELASALGVDLATARTIAAVRHSTVALRSGEEAALLPLVENARTFGIRATVVAREALYRLPSAQPVVRALPDYSWLLGVDDPWNAVADLLSSEGLPSVGGPQRLDDVRLVTIGEVEVRLVREANEDSRWARNRSSTDIAGADRRRAVLDLHTPTAILRIVEGMTDLAPLDPGVPNRAALKRLVEQAPSRWPGAGIEPRRLCPATHAPVGVTGARLISGWPSWEEHTRMCRLHQNV